MPLATLEDWLEALAGSRDAKLRRRLQVAAWLTHAPEGLVEYVGELERRLNEN